MCKKKGEWRLLFYECFMQENCNYGPENSIKCRVIKFLLHQMCLPA